METRRVGICVIVGVNGTACGAWGGIPLAARVTSGTRVALAANDADVLWGGCVCVGDGDDIGGAVGLSTGAGVSFAPLDGGATFVSVEVV